MTYEYLTQTNSPNNSGARPHRPTEIVIHHWGQDGQEFQNVVNYLSRANGSSSAHFVVQAGMVSCIVDPDDIAWHAGDWQANVRAIGIECRPEAQDGDYATVAELIADLWATYGTLALHPHNRYSNTACPGDWDLARLDREANAIQHGGGELVDNPIVSHPKPPRPRPNPEKPDPIAVDGIWGRATTRALQTLAGTPTDGIISSQEPAHRRRMPAMNGSTVKFSNPPGGSILIASVQDVLGVKSDGILGPDTIRSWQKRVGAKPDGYMGAKSTWKIQKRVNRGKI